MSRRPGGRRARARVHGLHAVRSVLAGEPGGPAVPGTPEGPGAVLRLYHLEGRHDRRASELLRLAREAGAELVAAPRAELDRLAGGGNHQGVVAELRPGTGGAAGAGGVGPAPTASASAPDAAAVEHSAAGLLEWLHRADRPASRGAPLVLVLDGVTDPHNLGACLRSADAAGVDAVLVPKDAAVGLTPIVRKVACGAAETVPLFRATNLARSLDELKSAGFWLHGAAGEGETTLWDARFDGPCALACGAEGRGLRRLTRERCDTLFRIPMAGSVESLNVSVATGIALFEVRRQRAGVASDPGPGRTPARTP